MNPLAKISSYRACLCAFASLVLLTDTSHSSTGFLTKKGAECLNRRVRSEETIRIFELHYSNQIFAKYDENCNGKLDKSEISKIERDAYSETEDPRKRPPRLDHIRLTFEETGIPFERFASKPASKEDEKRKQRFFLRRDRIDIGLASSIPSFSGVSGASISTTRDYTKSETVWNVQGVASYLLWKNTAAGAGEHAAGEPYISGYALAPFVEFSGRTSSLQSKPVEDRLLFGGLGQFEIFSGPLFDKQLITLSGYHQTDFLGQADINGGKITWEPAALGWGLGSIKPFMRIIDYTWRFAASGDFRAVGNPGRTNLQANSEYIWLGAQPMLKIWPFPKRIWQLPDLFHSAYVKLSPSYFHNAANVSGKASPEKDAWSFSGTLGFNIDPKGHASIEVEYKTGMDYMTGVKSDQLQSNLTLKY